MILNEFLQVANPTSGTRNVGDHGEDEGVGDNVASGGQSLISRLKSKAQNIENEMRRLTPKSANLMRKSQPN